MTLDCTTICRYVTDWWGFALQTSPHKGRAPCESPRRALRSQRFRDVRLSKSIDYLSRDNGYSHFNFSHFCGLGNRRAKAPSLSPFGEGDTENVSDETIHSDRRKRNITRNILLRAMLPLILFLNAFLYDIIRLKDSDCNDRPFLLSFHCRHYLLRSRMNWTNRHRLYYGSILRSESRPRESASD